MISRPSTSLGLSERLTLKDEPESLNEMPSASFSARKRLLLRVSRDLWEPGISGRADRREKRFPLRFGAFMISHGRI